MAQVASAMEPPKKHARKGDRRTGAERVAAAAQLSALRHAVPHLTAAALAAVADAAKHHLLPEGKIDRNLVREGRDARCLEVTPYGPIHKSVNVAMKSGHDVELELQNPFAMFWKVCRCSYSFSMMVSQTLATCPNSPATPWGLIVYSDEVTPGNQLLTLNARKTWAFYWSIFEFGPAVLADEEAWFEVLLCRSVQSTKVKGGVSALFAIVLKAFFNPNGHHMGVVGIKLQMHDGSRVRVYVKLLLKLADEAALHYSFGCKGSSGLKPCLKCLNVFNHSFTAGRGISITEDSVAVDTTCFDKSRFIPTTKAKILEIMDYLADKHNAGSEAFKDACTNLGWTWVPCGVLSDPFLRDMIDPSQQSAYDPMHILFVNGLFGHHVHELINALQPRVTYARLHQYAAAWTWPHRLRSATGLNALAPEKARSSWKAKAFKCTASEGRSLVPVLANYVENTVMKSDDAHVLQHGACFLLLVEVIEVIEVTNRRDAVAPLSLATASQAYLNSFKHLYGVHALVQKHHMLLHLADQLTSFLPSCYCLERKHKNVKKFAWDVRNASGHWDKTVLREITCRHISVLQDENSVHFQSNSCLQNPHKPSQTMLSVLQSVFGSDADIQCSATARINQYEQCTRGDVVMLCEGPAGFGVGQVQLHASCYSSTTKGVFSLVSVWRLTENDGRRSVWTVQDEPLHLVHTSDILCACIWSVKDDIATVLHPKAYR